jgi:hypothetical protein
MTLTSKLQAVQASCCTASQEGFQLGLLLGRLARVSESAERQQNNNMDAPP